MKFKFLLIIFLPLIINAQKKSGQLIREEIGILFISPYNCNYDYQGSGDVYPESCFADLFYPMKILDSDIWKVLNSCDTLKNGLKLGLFDNRNYYKSISNKIECDSSFCFRHSLIFAIPVKIKFKLYSTHQDMSICGGKFFDLILKGRHILHCTNLNQGLDIIKITLLKLSAQ